MSLTIVNPGWLRWPALALLLAVITVAFELTSRQPAPACPGTSLYRPELQELSTAELEQRVATLPLMRPSDARRQLAALRVTAEGYAAAQRECMYRAMLMGMVNSSRSALETQPALWGHTRELGSLRSLFLELPLKKTWTLEQRQAVLGKIETLFIANLAAVDEADRDFWRHQYLGLEVLCEVTDEALATLHTQRPESCLNLEP